MLSEEKQTQFAALRRQIIAAEFGRMNPRQLEGVLTTEGPLLLLAGAGSGKTTVLINRIANLLRYGRGADSAEVPDHIEETDLAFLADYASKSDHTEQEDARAHLLCALEPAAPWQVIAITFTNKAAGELKQRLEDRIGPDAQDVWAATFHSACVRILRRDIEKLGFPSSFTIYDTDDSLRVIKESLKALNMDDKSFPPRSVLGYISRAKDDMQLAEDFLDQAKAQGDFRLQKIGNVYLAYQKKLWAAGALDFDDIILHTVRLLQKFPEVREYYQRKFHYVLIDEYQDTNHLQYLLAALLAGERKNICVVGDDDQSIYRFRGATIENILSFESEYKNARVIRLEQNYRSTGNILEAANAVIRNNRGRKGKNLWTDHGEGEKVRFYTAGNEQEEGMYVASPAPESLWRGAAVAGLRSALPHERPLQPSGNGPQEQQHPLPRGGRLPLLRAGGDQRHAVLPLRHPQPQRRPAPAAGGQQPAPRHRGQDHGIRPIPGGPDGAAPLGSPGPRGGDPGAEKSCAEVPKVHRPHPASPAPDPGSGAAGGLRDPDPGERLRRECSRRRKTTRASLAWKTSTNCPRPSAAIWNTQRTPLSAASWTKWLSTPIWTAWRKTTTA